MAIVNFINPSEEAILPEIISAEDLILQATEVNNDMEQDAAEEEIEMQKISIKQQIFTLQQAIAIMDVENVAFDVVLALRNKVRSLQQEQRDAIQQKKIINYFAPKN